jgi:internalin A
LEVINYHRSLNQYQLSHLNELNIELNQLSTLPSSISALTNLNVLKLGYNQLSTLPESISALPNLRVLDLSHNRLTTLPLSISTLTNLNELHLFDNRLPPLPSSISTLTNLNVLNIGHNQLSTFPESISTLTNLNVLNLKNNQLSTLPSSISTLTNLNVLDIGDNQLTTLPSSISTLTNLDWLYLYDNQLTTLPSTISALLNLSVFDISVNQLSTLPLSISTLTNLNELDLSTNQLSTLPSSISKLTNLRKFKITGNSITSPPPALVAQGHEAIRFYYQSSSNDRLKKLKIANKKVLLVGEGQVGKTSLFNALKNESQFESETTERTKGVDVHSLELKNGAVSIWDFAGQEEFFSSHNIFTKDNQGRSLFIVVFRLNDDDDIIKQSIKKWTLVAVEKSPQSDTILVPTHLDKVEDVEEQKEFVEITRSELAQSVRERIKELFCVSNATKQGIEQVKEYIDGKCH